ncbi:ATP-binding protein [Bacteroidales bacterium OttesenSCG-928-L14]|nr:ATP-binding protein [Bacteroidales bacterium OttesenSCG-928-L14]
MKRKITDALIEWKDSKNRKPLIVNGARQIGKTYIINEFGNTHFSNLVYINLEVSPLIREIFEGNIEPSSLIQNLESHTGQRFIAGETLLFLDEIQSSERALTSLKYFCEQAPQYHILAAGSLLGVAINRHNYSFPVGKVDEMNMYPFDFEEFLWAFGQEKLAEKIREHYKKIEPLSESLHKLALELYNNYCIIGGMPEVITDFIQNKSFLTIRNPQAKILNEYIADMAKYADPATSVKIKACYDSIPSQLAKENRKFQYKIVQKGGTATIFGVAIDWLKQAGIVLKCQKIEHGFIPIKAYQYFPDFKLYMSDVGMLTMLSGFPPQMILNSIETNNTFMGAIVENYVAQAFASNSIPLYYWKSEEKAEIDFVLQDNVDVIPVEVKKGLRTRSGSLALFIKKYNSPYAIRISQKNFGFENNIKSLPLYALFCLEKV